MKRPAVVVLLLAVLAPGVSGAQERGSLLVATDAVTEEAFAETVILLVHYGPDGAIGVAINRPTWVTTREAFPDSAALDSYRGRVFHGGPLAQATVLVLSREASQPVDAIGIVDDVYMSSDLQQLETEFNARVDTDKVLRFYAGHASWRPGQLEEEITAGSWLVLRGSTATVFDADPGSLWRRLSAEERQLSVRVDAAAGPSLRGEEFVSKR